MKKFEYMISETDTQYGDAPFTLEKLNQLGNDGWEMCGSTVATTYGGILYNVYYFKREVINHETI